MGYNGFPRENPKIEDQSDQWFVRRRRNSLKTYLSERTWPMSQIRPGLAVDSNLTISVYIYINNLDIFDAGIVLA
jgi:hypothetical protein